MISLSSNNDGHTVPKTCFTSLHFTILVDTTPHLNFTQLHFTTLSFGLTPLNFLPLHFTSLQFTALLDDFRRPSIPFASPAYNCLPNSVSKNFRFTRVSP